MGGVRVGVVGAAGYSGAVAARLVASHPEIELAFASSDTKAGEPVEAHLALPTGGATPLRFTPNEEAVARAEECGAVILATSAEVSARLAPELVRRGKVTVDLSGAFRLEHASDYPRWYGFEHPSPDLLGRAHYGLPELFGAPPRGSVLVANPGCYPTAALLALAPLVRAGLVEPAGIMVDGTSGATGAGRQSGEAWSFVEVDEDVRAYKILRHQHTPEMERGLGARVTFTAHLAPLRRGLLVTAYARPRSGATPARVAECLADAYAKRPFVDALPPESVAVRSVVGTNHAHVGATANDDVVVAVAAIDNLLKGAAGQAVQNLNLLHGWSEAAGLAHLQRVAP
jgi:N-acetyl-gamma-glutamyl-phosphate reductase